MHDVDTTFAPRLRALQIGMWWQTANAGGLDRVYVDLCRFLPDAGVETFGVVEGPSDVASLTEGRIQSYSAGPVTGLKRLWATRRKIEAMIRHDRFDVVAAHFSLHAATVLDRVNRLPFVMHFHGPWAEEAREEGAARLVVGAKALLERTVYGRADRVIVLSKAFRTLACEQYGVPEDRIRIVPGSVDLQRFCITKSKAEARGELNWPLDRPILLAVRRLTPRMGLDRLIEAMVQVKRFVPDVLLYIAGTGPLAGQLQRRVTEAGLDEHVRFLGFLPDADLPRAYRAADINVVPTTSLEGFGLVAAEALAAGTPSLVTPVGGLPEVVEDLSPNLVCDSASAEAISDAINGALHHGRRLPSENECRVYAENRFSSELAAARVADVYRELVTKIASGVRSPPLGM